MTALLIDAKDAARLIGAGLSKVLGGLLLLAILPIVAGALAVGFLICAGDAGGEPKA